MKLNIGMVSTRFAGLDGVSLEAAKWAEVLEGMGHRCYWLAGELDRPSNISVLVPEAHFQSDRNLWIIEQVFDRNRRSPQASAVIHDLRAALKIRLDHFIDRFRIDFLIVENALTIPMHIPLGLALTEIIAERAMPAILHHHDFYWERARYAENGVADFLRTAFPPALPSAVHVVINSAAREQLAHRCRLPATLIPNVMDFDRPVSPDQTRQRALLSAMNIHPEDKIVLQPTRVVQRKGIEHAIDLVRELKLPHCKLIVSHAAGDEGMAYAHWLKRYAAHSHVDLKFLEIKTARETGNTFCLANHYHDLWALYDRSDFVTFPSLAEGFGNALLEAIYFRKPVLINRYDTFIRDIEPFGLDLVSMDGILTGQQVEEVRHILTCPERQIDMTTRNFEIARAHFSYKCVRSCLKELLEPIVASARPTRSEPTRRPHDTVIPIRPRHQRTAPPAVRNAVSSCR
ncbi:MAG: glycosyltransferase family 4 protein [Desulfosarcina sp.]|nr:glycosyltransferase family 4 protein [Desulfobacterales bacterium]